MLLLAHADASLEHWVECEDLALVPLGLHPTPVEVGSSLPLPLPQGIDESFYNRSYFSHGLGSLPG